MNATLDGLWRGKSCHMKFIIQDYEMKTTQTEGETAKNDKPAEVTEERIKKYSCLVTRRDKRTLERRNICTRHAHRDGLWSMNKEKKVLENRGSMREQSIQGETGHNVDTETERPHAPRHPRQII